MGAGIIPAPQVLGYAADFAYVVEADHEHAKEHVRAKTGLYEHVRTLSGYAQTASGANVAFSIMANNTLEGRHAMETIDRIVEAIVEDKAP